MNKEKTKIETKTNTLLRKKENFQQSVNTGREKNMSLLKKSGNDRHTNLDTNF